MASFSFFRDYRENRKALSFMHPQWKKDNDEKEAPAAFIK